VNFTSEELKHLEHVLHCASSFTIARSREVVSPSVDHYKLKEKIKMYQERMHW
jgi:hypothetical protein